MKCKHCGQEIPKEKPLKIPELKINVFPIQDYKGRYEDIKIPNGKRLIKVWELIWILDSKYDKQFLGNYKGKDNFFWCKQLKYDKQNKRSRGLTLYGDLDLSSYWDYLPVSNAGGRVVFVEDLK